MKKATAVLLQNMLARIKNLEKQVQDVIVNSTSALKDLSKAIKSLNNSINHINRTRGKGNRLGRDCRNPLKAPISVCIFSSLFSLFPLVLVGRIYAKIKTSRLCLSFSLFSWLACLIK